MRPDHHSQLGKSKCGVVVGRERRTEARKRFGAACVGPQTFSTRQVRDVRPQQNYWQALEKCADVGASDGSGYPRERVAGFALRDPRPRRNQSGD